MTKNGSHPFATTSFTSLSKVLENVSRSEYRYAGAALTVSCVRRGRMAMMPRSTMIKIRSDLPWAEFSPILTDARGTAGASQYRLQRNN
jgi:hypothetical protein